MLKYEFVQYDYKSINSPKDRRVKEHMLAYSLLDKMLNDEGLLKYEILRTENGKPYIMGQPLHFNISHTDGLVAVCISDTPVGIDCERVDFSFESRIKDFSNRYFTENEISLIEKNAYSPSCFFEIWTKKEAMIKRDGLNGSYLKKLDSTKQSFETIKIGEYIISIFK
jgi:phosphopantetheinyl transferase